MLVIDLPKTKEHLLFTLRKNHMRLKKSLIDSTPPIFVPTTFLEAILMRISQKEWPPLPKAIRVREIFG